MTLGGALTGNSLGSVVKYARVNATSDGANTVITAVAGKRLLILGYVLVVNAAGAITLQDSAGSPNVFCVFDLAANGGVSYAGGIEAPAFVVLAGNGFVISNGAGVDTKGHVSYLEL